MREILSARILLLSLLGILAFVAAALATVSLTPLAPLAAGDGPVGLAAGNSSSTTLLAVALQNVNSVVVYQGSLGQFTTLATLALPGIPRAVTVADLDRDDLDDIVVAEDTRLDVYLNLGGGSFSLTILPVTPIGSWSASVRDVIAADLNGDGHLDLATANQEQDSIAWFFGDGSGGFGAIQRPPVCCVGKNPYALVAADLDGDGDLDLAVANSSLQIAPNEPLPSTTGPSVTVLWNDGSGNFNVSRARSVPLPTSPEVSPVAIAAGDLDVDGDLDLVLGNFTGDATKEVAVLNNSGGLFSVDYYELGGRGRGVAVADYDHDGRPDAVLVSGANQLVVLPGAGDGTLLAPILFQLNSGSVDLAAADLDGDGDHDFATSNINGDDVSLLRNDSLPGESDVGIAGGGFRTSGRAHAGATKDVNIKMKNFGSHIEASVGYEVRVLSGDATPGAGCLGTVGPVPVTGSRSIKVLDANGDPLCQMTYGPVGIVELELIVTHSELGGDDDLSNNAKTKSVKVVP